MTKKQEIRYHIIFWMLFIALDYLLDSIMYQRNNEFFWSLFETLSFTLLHVVVFYINYLLVCPKTIPYKKWWFFAIGQLLLMILFPAIRYVSEEVIIYSITGVHNYNDVSRNVVYYFYDNSFYVFRILLLSVTFYCIKYMWNTTKKVNDLQLEKKQAELQALKNQLSPHFLFNILNSFYSDLFDTQPKIANDILKLSEMLRYVTYENENDLVLLADEIEFLKHYIDLFKRRFDDNVAVVFKHPKDVSNVKMPSLLLIHFVENAFKHGILNDESKPIIINLDMRENLLIFSASNYFSKSEHYDEPGIGHKNIRQRLELMYADRYSLTIQEDQNRYNIILNIPLL